MDSYFAAPEKTPPDELKDEIRIVSASPVMSGLLQSISGLVAIIDEHRQIVALNGSLLKMLGVDNPEHVLGLRHGDVLNCIHAQEEPAGCGTTKFCSTCGAAMAIVASLKQDLPVERLCALSARRDGKTMDLALLVRSQPIYVDHRRFLLILLQDVTVEQKRAALERVFFHDINNMLLSLSSASEMLADEHPSRLSTMVYESALRLRREVAIQRYLSDGLQDCYRPTWHTCAAEQIVAELENAITNHPAAKGKRIEISTRTPGLVITTDISALCHVVNNMVINALEATPDGGVVKMWTDREGDYCCFHVWNSGVIPENISQRIFQRNFSTKAQVGRGVGTYSMKLFGEEVLSGHVKFESSAEQGTMFTFSHPIHEVSHRVNRSLGFVRESLGEGAG
jgi:signal transduction histidine kinase